MKRPHRRSRVPLALLAMIALVVAACGDGDADDSPTTTPPETQTTAAGPDPDTTTTVGDQTDPVDPVTLEVWSWLPFDHELGEEVYAQIVADFEDANSHITVNLNPLPWPTFWDSWTNATIAGTGPDVISMYGGTTAGGYASSLLPLQDLVSTELLADLKFVDSATSPDGNLYALPSGSFAYYLLANENLVAELGLTAAEAFGDWDSLISTCTALSDAGIPPFATGWADGSQLEAFMYIFMTQLLDDASFDAWVAGELSMLDDRFETAMGHVVEMNEAGCFPEDSLGRPLYFDAFEVMVSGDGAAMSAGSAYTATDAEAQNGEGSMAVLPFPQVPGSQHDVISDAGPNQGWAATSWTDHPEEAAAFIEHLLSPASQQLLWEMTELPPNLNSYEPTSDNQLVNDYLDLINRPNSRTTYMAFTQQAEAVMQREAIDLIARRTTPEAILALADAAQRQALDAMAG